MAFVRGTVSCDEFEFEFYEEGKDIDINNPEQWGYKVRNADNYTLEKYMLNKETTNFFDEAYVFAKGHLTAMGLIPVGDIENFHNIINAYLCGKFSQLKLRLIIFDDNNEIMKKDSISAPMDVNADHIRLDENELIDIGIIAIQRIGKFLVEAKWHSDYDKVTSKQIIWFGLDGEPPIDCWSITKERIRAGQVLPFWFPSSGMIDWHTVCPDWNEAVETWLFAECGEAEPDGMYQAIESCPIELISDDTSEMLERKFVTYFEGKRP